MADEVVITEYTEEVVEMAYHEEEMSSGLECRVCLQTTHSGIPLALKIQFEVADQTTELTLQQVMVLICIVRIDGEDEELLPKFVCENCKTGLISAYSLRLIAQNTVRLLKERLNEMDRSDIVVVKQDPEEELNEEEDFVLENSPESSKDCDHDSLDCHDSVAQKGKTQSEAEKKIHKCTICHKSFNRRSLLQLHMHIHTGDSPFLCSECGKTFSSMQILREHTRIHTGEKPFACEHCPSTFATRRYLMLHMKMHTGARPYSCDLCSKAFTRNVALVKHKRMHTGERPFPCESCNKRFTSANHLARHVRIHTGEKPYKCKHCERKFSQSGELVQHMRRHVGECTYQCEQCPQAFKYHRELRSHIEEHFRQTKELKEKTTLVNVTIMADGE